MQGRSERSRVAAEVADPGGLILGDRIVAEGLLRGRRTRCRMKKTFTSARRRSSSFQWTSARNSVALADAGFWNTEQIATISASGIRALVSPDNRRRKSSGQYRQKRITTCGCARS